MRSRTDGQLFYWLSEGLPGTGMPGFKSRLSEKERWDVLNYIKANLIPTDR